MNENNLYSRIYMFNNKDGEKPGDGASLPFDERNPPDADNHVPPNPNRRTIRDGLHEESRRLNRTISITICSEG